MMDELLKYTKLIGIGEKMKNDRKFSIFELLFLISILVAGSSYFAVPEQHKRYEHALTVLKHAKNFLLG